MLIFCKVKIKFLTFRKNKNPMKKPLFLLLLIITQWSFSQELMSKSATSDIYSNESFGTYGYNRLPEEDINLKGSLYVATPVEYFNSFENFIENKPTSSVTAAQNVPAFGKKKQEFLTTFNKKNYLSSLSQLNVKSQALPFSSILNPETGEKINKNVVGIKYNNQIYYNLKYSNSTMSSRFVKLQDLDKDFPYYTFSKEEDPEIYKQFIRTQQTSNTIGNVAGLIPSLIMGTSLIPGAVIAVGDELFSATSKLMLNYYSYKDKNGNRQFIVLLDKNAILESDKKVTSALRKNGSINSKAKFAKICKAKNIDFSRKDLTYEKALELIQQLNQPSK
ncbi:MAG: hypothetical protein C4K58_03910 [Flavobacteriaceae bacterium]|nr:MAG: hypothetical protein C4K58_03910 [Flavobacteriaceae bacterium]